MKIELSLEMWTELFGFVPLWQLKQLVPHIGDETRKREWGGRKCHQTIQDRQFVSLVQFFLHKFGEVTLGRLHIYGNEPCVSANANIQYGNPLPLADVPMPENVKNFKSILISNFDESVIAFLRKFEQNSLLDKVNLCFHFGPDFLPEIMANFVPLFTNINSIEIGSGNSELLDQLQCEYFELTSPIFASARVLTADYNRHDVWYCDWLKTPREDGKPRVLFLCGDNMDGPSLSHYHFIKHIKKDFMEANQAVSFFIELKKFRDDASVQSLTLENGQTREKMVIKGANESYDPVVTISRCPMGTNEEEWGEEMSQPPNFDNRTIKFDPYPDIII